MTAQQRRDLWFAVALFLLALLPRLYVALTWAREPVWDGHYYHFGASRIAEGLGYSEDVMIDGQPVWKAWCHYPVGYSGLLGFSYALLGNELWVAPVVNAVIGAITAVAVFLLASYCLSPMRARIAGVLCAAHPGLIAYTALVMTEPLSALTLVLGGLLALIYRRRAWWGPAASGIALGLGALVRPTALLAIPWLAGIFRGTWRKRLLLTAAAGAVALFTVMPWTLRNCRVMDGCALVSTNGGWNLAIGAVTETGRFTALKAQWGCPGPGQVKQDRCWGAFGRRTIAHDPVRWLSLIPKKLAHTYNHESFAIGYLGEADPQAWPDPRKNYWRTLLTVVHHLLMLCAALAVVGVPRWGASNGDKTLTEQVRGRPFFYQLAVLAALAAYCTWTLGQAEPALFWVIVVAPLVAFAPLPGAPQRPAGVTYAWGLVLMTSLTHAAFFGDDRYHLTISPVLCMLAAGALRPMASRRPTLNLDSNSLP